MSAQHVVVT